MISKSELIILTIYDVVDILAVGLTMWWSIVIWFVQLFQGWIIYYIIIIIIIIYIH